MCWEELRRLGYTNNAKRIAGHKYAAGLLLRTLTALRKFTFKKIKLHQIYS